MLKIWKAKVTMESGAPGVIKSADKNGITVGCARDALNILELQREGGRRMTAEQFLTGYPLKAGDIFA